MPISKQRIERRLALRDRRRGGRRHERGKSNATQAPVVVRSNTVTTGFLAAMKDFIERFNSRNKTFEIRRRTP